MVGEVYNIHIDHMKMIVSKCFPKCVPFKRKKTKVWAFKYLRRIRPLDDDSCSHVQDGNNQDAAKAKDFSSVDNEQEAKAEADELQKGLHVEEKSLTKLSEVELTEKLKPRLEQFDLPGSVLETIIEEEITGRVFERLKLEYMEATFPYLSKGKRISLLLLRDDICREETAQPSVDTSENVPDETSVDKEEDQPTLNVTQHENSGQFRETFRKFDREAAVTDKYRRGAILTTYNNRPSNLLDPVHVFSHSDESFSTRFSDAIVEFVAACLNERSNGTIHLGVDPKTSEFQIEGEIKGLKLEVIPCLKQIYQGIEKRFYKDQLPLVLKCVRPPQFIDVTSKEKLRHRLRVLEIDVVPQSEFISDEVFFVKSRDDSKPVLFLFNENGISPQNVSDEKTVSFMSKDKNLLADARKSQEKQPRMANIKPNLRQKILDLLSAGDETMSSDQYPLLFLSPFDSSAENKIDMNHFEFLIDLDPNAVFDFDYTADSKGLYGFFDADKEQVFKALTTDNFDPNSEENKFKKETYSNLLEDITLSVLKPWVFCNGYDAMSKSPMNIMDWKQNRSKGFKEAIRFYNNEIPQGRALILIFLLSKNFDILMEAAEEAILSFKDQWVVFAENEDIANLWTDNIVNKKHTVDKDTCKFRTVIGMPWEHVNLTIKELTGSKRIVRCEIPTSTGAFCHLKEKKRNELVDIEILSRNECEDLEVMRDKQKLAQIQREEEEKFYRGENVSWWNFMFPDQVLKRDVHSRLKKKVEEALEGQHTDEDNKIGLVNIFHQPGAGATTTARHILWDLKAAYRCCIVKQITDQTVEQITVFRNYDEKDDPKPPLILIENGDEEKVGELYALLQHRARIMARRSSDMKVFCVLLLCTRRSNIHTVDDTSVALKHELSQKELAWFRNRNKDLERQFQDKGGPDPRFLISFNILKENFNTKYIHRTAVELVKGVTNDNERKVLKYLSMLNTFDLDFQSIPISAFDPLMTVEKRGYTITFGLSAGRGKRLNKSWEQTISQPLQVLLNRNTRAGFGSQLVGLSIVNPLFSAEIFSCFNQPPETTSQIVMEFLECPIFKSSNMSINEVKKVVRTILKKRDEKEEKGKEKFSPLIMKLLNEENEEIAVNVLIKGFEMTDDPMICQQIARLYIHSKNWKLAAKFANMATDMKPQNSFLWDTFGQVFKNQLYDKYSRFLEEGKIASEADIEEAIDIAQQGLQKFRKEQEVCEVEHFYRVNDAGYFGEIRMIILLLDVLRFCPRGQTKARLHTYLTDKTFISKDMPNLKPESVEFLKGLESRSELTLKALEDKSTQLKDNMFYSIFGQEISRRKAIATLRENLDSYFGEDSDVIPDHLSETDKADFRRRRVRRLGGRNLSNFIHIENEANLEIILQMLMDNVKSDEWQPFDIVSLFNVVIAMKILKIKQSYISYNEMVQFSRKCYDKVVSSMDLHTYLEAYMYFVLLNWPTKSRLQNSQKYLCATEQLNEASKKWKAAFHANHPRQKESRPVRKRETTNFFLGRGDEMDAVVHYEELLDPWGKKFVHGDKFWQYSDFVKKVLRIPGTLINDGNEIICSVETRTGGMVQLLIPTSFPIGERSLWQKRVYFVLGFSWAGLKAFDVRQDIPDVSDLPVEPKAFSGSSRQTAKKPPDQCKTHESFMQKLNDIKRQIDKIKMDKTKQGVGREQYQYLDRQQAKWEEKQQKLLKARMEFYET